MNNRITVEEVSNQFAKAITLLLEWTQQEFQTQKNLSNQVERNYQAQSGIDELLKAKEVADILKVSRSLVYRMMMRGEIPTVRLGKAVRVRHIDLEALIQKV